MREFLGQYFQSIGNPFHNINGLVAKLMDILLLLDYPRFQVTLVKNKSLLSKEGDRLSCSYSVTG